MDFKLEMDGVGRLWYLFRAATSAHSLGLAGFTLKGNNDLARNCVRAYMKLTSVHSRLREAHLSES